MTISLVFKLFDFILNKGAVRCDNFIYIGLFDKYKNMEILKVQGNKSSRQIWKIIFMDVESIRIAWKPHKYTTQLILFLRRKLLAWKAGAKDSLPWAS